MIGPCMCGDTHCPSCGPAQGNWKCSICHVWADDGCAHIDESGALYPEFEAQAHAIAKAEREADERFAAEMIEAEKYWSEK